MLSAQTIVEYDGTNTDAQMTLIETGAVNDFSRLIFKHSTDLANRWTIASMSQNGQSFGTLDSPISFAYSSATRLLLGKNGKLRINNAYTLPNVDGTNGQVLTTDGAGNVSWASSGGGSSLWTETQGPRYSNSGPRFARINSTNGSNTGFMFENNGLQEAVIWHEPSSGDLIFTNTNGSTRHMVIDGVNQNVGIGESNPADELHITGTTGVDIRLEASNAKYLRFYEGTTRKGSIGHDGNAIVMTNTETGGDMRFTTTDLTQFFAGGFQNMAIEADGDVTVGRNALYVDERGIDNDRVGINNTTPSSALHVNHFNNGATGGFRLQNNASNGWWKFYVSSSNNTMQLRNNTSASVVGTFATNGVYTASDKRIKKNLETLPYGLKDVMKLKALRYNYISDQADDNKSLGFVAQDLNDILPELVLYQEDADQYSVNYAGMSVVAIKAIQEQQVQIESLISENAALKNQITSILARLDAEGK